MCSRKSWCSRDGRPIHFANATARAAGSGMRTHNRSAQVLHSDTRCLWLHGRLGICGRFSSSSPRCCVVSLEEYTIYHRVSVIFSSPAAVAGVLSVRAVALMCYVPHRSPPLREPRACGSHNGETRNAPFSSVIRVWVISWVMRFSSSAHRIVVLGYTVRALTKGVSSLCSCCCSVWICCCSCAC